MSFQGQRSPVSGGRLSVGLTISHNSDGSHSVGFRLCSHQQDSPPIRFIQILPIFKSQNL